jgi:hypothetical protein
VIEDRKLTQEQKDSISRANLAKANQAKKSSRSSSRMDHSMEVDSGELFQFLFDQPSIPPNSEPLNP